RREVDVNDRLLAVGIPELRRVLDRIVAYCDDQVGLVEPARDVVPRLKPDRQQAEVVVVWHRAFRHERVRDGNAVSPGERPQLAGRSPADDAVAREDQWERCGFDQPRRRLEGLAIW